MGSGRRATILVLGLVLICTVWPASAQRGWGRRKKEEATDFASMNQRATEDDGLGTALGGDEAMFMGQMAAMGEKMKTLTERLAVVAESRALEASPTKKTFVRLMRNDPVLNREVDGWAETFETMMEPYLTEMPIDDQQFAKDLPELQQGYRKLADTMASGEMDEDWMRNLQALGEMAADPEKLMESMATAMDQITTNPAYAAQMEEAIASVTSPEFFNEVTSTLKAMGSSDEQIQEMRQMWEDPSTQASVKEMFSNPEAMKEMFSQFAGMDGGAGMAGLAQPPRGGRRRQARVEL